jgi:hypothetical protein
MRLPKLALLISLLSPLLLSPAYAQRGGGHGGGGGGGHAGGAVRGGFSGGGSFRGGGFRGGYYGGRGYFYGGRFWGPSIYFGFGGWGYPYYPYYSAYPSYYGYDPYYDSYDPYAYGGSDSTQPPAQNYGYPSQPPQGQGQPAPPPQTQPQSSTGNSQGQNFYLIAFKDHTVQAATAYKVDGDQIHWITREGQEMQAPFSSVDVRYSQQINHDRHVEFPIP